MDDSTGQELEIKAPEQRQKFERLLGGVKVDLLGPTPFSADGALEMIEKACQKSESTVFGASVDNLDRNGIHIFQVANDKGGGSEVWAIDNRNPKSITVCKVALKEGELLENLTFSEGRKWADVVVIAGQLQEEDKMTELKIWAQQEGRNWEWGLAQVPDGGSVKTIATSYESDVLQGPLKNTTGASRTTGELFAEAANAVLYGKPPAVPVSATP
ncbi:MAG: hypothetical protein Q8P89_04780 [bacterium]|nr:hypothetical protein [bacterium]